MEYIRKLKEENEALKSIVVQAPNSEEQIFQSLKEHCKVSEASAKGKNIDDVIIERDALKSSLAQYKVMVQELESVGDESQNIKREMSRKDIKIDKLLASNEKQKSTISTLEAQKTKLEKKVAALEMASLLPTKSPPRSMVVKDQEIRQLKQMLIETESELMKAKSAQSDCSDKSLVAEQIVTFRQKVDSLQQEKKQLLTDVAAKETLAQTFLQALQLKDAELLKLTGEREKASQEQSTLQKQEVERLQHQISVNDVESNNAKRLFAEKVSELHAAKKEIGKLKDELKEQKSQAHKMLTYSQYDNVQKRERDALEKELTKCKNEIQEMKLAMKDKECKFLFQKEENKKLCDQIVQLKLTQRVLQRQGKDICTLKIHETIEERRNMLKELYEEKIGEVVQLRDENAKLQSKLKRFLLAEDSDFPESKKRKLHKKSKTPEHFMEPINVITQDFVRISTPAAISPATSIELPSSTYVESAMQWRASEDSDSRDRFRRLSEGSETRIEWQKPPEDSDTRVQCQKRPRNSNTKVQCQKLSEASDSRVMQQKPSDNSDNILRPSGDNDSINRHQNPFANSDINRHQNLVDNSDSMNRHQNSCDNSNSKDKHQNMCDNSDNRSLHQTPVDNSDSRSRHQTLVGVSDSRNNRQNPFDKRESSIEINKHQNPSDNSDSRTKPKVSDSDASIRCQISSDDSDSITMTERSSNNDQFKKSYSGSNEKLKDSEIHEGMKVELTILKKLIGRHLSPIPKSYSHAMSARSRSLCGTPTTKKLHRLPSTSLVNSPKSSKDHQAKSQSGPFFMSLMSLSKLSENKHLLKQSCGDLLCVLQDSCVVASATSAVQAIFSYFNSALNSELEAEPENCRLTSQCLAEAILCAEREKHLHGLVSMFLHEASSRLLWDRVISGFSVTMTTYVFTLLCKALKNNSGVRELCSNAMKYDSGSHLQITKTIAYAWPAAFTSLPTPQQCEDSNSDTPEQLSPPVKRAKSDSGEDEVTPKQNARNSDSNFSSCVPINELNVKADFKNLSTGAAVTPPHELDNQMEVKESNVKNINNVLSVTSEFLGNEKLADESFNSAMEQVPPKTPSFEPHGHDGTLLKENESSVLDQMFTPKSPSSGSYGHEEKNLKESSDGMFSPSSSPPGRGRKLLKEEKCSAANENFSSESPSPEHCGHDEKLLKEARNSASDQMFSPKSPSTEHDGKLITENRCSAADQIFSPECPSLPGPHVHGGELLPERKNMSIPEQMLSPKNMSTAPPGHEKELLKENKCSVVDQMFSHKSPSPEPQEQDGKLLKENRCFVGDQMFSSESPSPESHGHVRKLLNESRGPTADQMFSPKSPSPGQHRHDGKLLKENRCSAVDQMLSPSNSPPRHDRKLLKENKCSAAEGRMFSPKSPSPEPCGCDVKLFKENRSSAADQLFSPKSPSPEPCGQNGKQLQGNEYSAADEMFSPRSPSPDPCEQDGPIVNEIFTAEEIVSPKSPSPGPLSGKVPNSNIHLQKITSPGDINESKLPSPKLSACPLATKEPSRRLLSDLSENEMSDDSGKNSDHQLGVQQPKRELYFSGSSASNSPLTGSPLLKDVVPINEDPVSCDTTTPESKFGLRSLDSGSPGVSNTESVIMPKQFESTRNDINKERCSQSDESVLPKILKPLQFGSKVTLFCQKFTKSPFGNETKSPITKVRKQKMKFQTSIPGVSANNLSKALETLEYEPFRKAKLRKSNLSKGVVATPSDNASIQRKGIVTANKNSDASINENRLLVTKKTSAAEELFSHRSPSPSPPRHDGNLLESILNSQKLTLPTDKIKESTLPLSKPSAINTDETQPPANSLSKFKIINRLTSAVLNKPAKVEKHDTDDDMSDDSSLVIDCGEAALPVKQYSVNELFLPGNSARKSPCNISSQFKNMPIKCNKEAVSCGTTTGESKLRSTHLDSISLNISDSKNVILPKLFNPVSKVHELNSTIDGKDIFSGDGKGSKILPSFHSGERPALPVNPNVSAQSGKTSKKVQKPKKLLKNQKKKAGKKKNAQGDASFPSSGDLSEALETLERLPFQKARFKMCQKSLSVALCNPARVPNGDFAVAQFIQFLSSSKRNPLMSFLEANDRSVLVPVIEKCLVNSINFIDGKKKIHLSGLVDNFLRTAEQTILRNNSITIHGIAALCRVSALIYAARKEFLSIRYIAYQLLQYRPIVAHTVIASMFGVNLDIAKTSTDYAGCKYVNKVWSGVLMKRPPGLADMQWKQATAVFQKVGGLDAQDINEDTSLAIAIGDCLHQMPAKNSELKEYERSLLLLALKNGWDWSRDVLLRVVINKAVSPLTSESLPANLNIEALAAFVRLIASIDEMSPVKDRTCSIFLGKNLQKFVGSTNTDYFPIMEAIHICMFRMALHHKEMIPLFMQKWLEQNEAHLSPETIQWLQMQ